MEVEDEENPYLEQSGEGRGRGVLETNSNEEVVRRGARKRETEAICCICFTSPFEYPGGEFCGRLEGESHFTRRACMTAQISSSTTTRQVAV